jgi:hypothetical protein
MQERGWNGVSGLICSSYFVLIKWALEERIASLEPMRWPIAISAGRPTFPVFHTSLHLTFAITSRRTVMTTPSDLNSLTPEERRDFGFARVRDAAFDAVNSLWSRRQAEGMTQADLAAAIAADAGWVSKNLRGPGNWTMRTFGAFVESLGGQAEIRVRAAEDPLPIRSNYHAYVEYPESSPSPRGAPLGAAILSTGTPGTAAARPGMRPLVTTLVP